MKKVTLQHVVHGNYRCSGCKSCPNDWKKLAFYDELNLGIIDRYQNWSFLRYNASLIIAALTLFPTLYTLT